MEYKYSFTMADFYQIPQKNENDLNIEVPEHMDIWIFTIFYGD